MAVVTCRNRRILFKGWILPKRLKTELYFLKHSDNCDFIQETFILLDKVTKISHFMLPNSVCFAHQIKHKQRSAFIPARQPFTIWRLKSVFYKVFNKALLNSICHHWNHLFECVCVGGRGARVPESSFQALGVTWKGAGSGSTGWPSTARAVAVAGWPSAVTG